LLIGIKALCMDHSVNVAPVFCAVSARTLLIPLAFASATSSRVMRVNSSLPSLRFPRGIGSLALEQPLPSPGNIFEKQVSSQPRSPSRHWLWNESSFHSQPSRQRSPDPPAYARWDRQFLGSVYHPLYLSFTAFIVA
jgi:hypothetical protein